MDTSGDGKFLQGTRGMGWQRNRGISPRIQNTGWSGVQVKAAGGKFTVFLVFWKDSPRRDPFFGPDFQYTLPARKKMGKEGRDTGLVPGGKNRREPLTLSELEWL